MAWTLGQLLGKICGKKHVRVAGDDQAYDGIYKAVATLRRELADGRDNEHRGTPPVVHGALLGHQRLLVGWRYGDHASSAQMAAGL